MNRNSIHFVWLLVLIVVGVAWFVFKEEPPPTPPAQPSQPTAPSAPGTPAEPVSASPHLRWGNPSRATKDLKDRNNYLIEKPYFALSYNNDKGTPNWVSWQLVRADLGHTPRNNQQFRSDEELPAGFKVVLNSDYDGSGFDRGHMCPFGDRTATERSGMETFVLTNAVPQSPNDNRKGWEQFEEYCRSLVLDHGKDLYVVAGPQGQGGVGSKGPRASLRGHNGEIVVPAVTWKVVLVLDAGKPPGPDARLIAVNIPNDQTVGEDWKPYLTSVKAVEALTGYTFFSLADPKIIGPLKEKVDHER